MHPHLGRRAQCRQDAGKGTHGATGVRLLKDAGGPSIDFCSPDGAVGL